MHATLGQCVKRTASRPAPSTAALLGAYIVATIVDVAFLAVADPQLVIEANPLLVASGSVMAIAVLRGGVIVAVAAVALALDDEWPVAGGLLVGTTLTLAAVINNIHVLTLL